MERRGEIRGSSQPQRQQEGPRGCRSSLVSTGLFLLGGPAMPLVSLGHTSCARFSPFLSTSFRRGVPSFQVSVSLPASCGAAAKFRFCRCCFVTFFPFLFGNNSTA